MAVGENVEDAVPEALTVGVTDPVSERVPGCEGVMERVVEPVPHWQGDAEGEALAEAAAERLPVPVAAPDPERLTEEQGDAEWVAEREPLRDAVAHTEAHAEGETDTLLVAERVGDTEEQPLPVLLALTVALCEGQPEFVGEGVPERVALAERDGVEPAERVRVTDTVGVPDMEPDTSTSGTSFPRDVDAEGCRWMRCMMVMLMPSVKSRRRRHLQLLRCRCC